MHDSTRRLRVTAGLLRSLAIYLNPRSVLRWRSFYREILKEGDLVFDVGAHVGSRARAMHTVGARVIAIEPQSPFSGFLRRTLPRGITVLDVAVGREQAEATMAVSSRHPTVSTLNVDFVASGATAVGFEHVRWDGQQSVQVVTLDALTQRFGIPSYIKIDVEGSELAVLEGLSGPVPLISVEYLPAFPHLAKALVDRLAALGMERFNIVEGENGAFLWPNWQDGASVKAWLDERDPASKSGDVFARPVRD